MINESLELEKVVEHTESLELEKVIPNLNPKVNSIDENYKDLKALIECLNLDYDKFKLKKVKVAGQRVRNNLLDTKKLCDKIRKQILEQIRDIPVKHRISGEKEGDESPGCVADPSEEKGEEKEDKPKKTIRKSSTKRANIKKD